MNSLNDLIQDFLEYCEIEKGHSELTIRNYEHYLNRFLEFMEDGRSREAKANSITLDKIRAYRLLVVVDRTAQKNDPIEKASFKKAILIGLSQALALIPGVSRSGATITAGRAFGFSREAAVKYSFMAALPIIAGATVFGLRDVSASTFTTLPWVLGFVASFASSFWAIKFLTKFVKKHNFDFFLYYRIALAGLVVLLYLLRG